MPANLTLGLTLHDMSGQRKYLSHDERRRFLCAAQKADSQTRLLCLLLSLTGCRVSEALSLTPQQIDAGTICVIFRTLKRRRLVFRAVPVPANFMRELVAYSWVMPREERLWKWCRQTAWRHVKEVMEAAKVKGICASPKGIRHGFGVANAEKNIPAALTQKWLGHARLETTTIYQQAVGAEERRFAKRLWADQDTP